MALEWCCGDAHGVNLRLTISPGAKQTEVVGLYGETLKVRVHAPPVDGKANEALLRWLAGKLDVSRQMLSLVSGETSRCKKIQIKTTASPEWVMKRLLSSQT